MGSLKPIRTSRGQSWAACTTEGLLLYSTHTDELFDPFDLDPSITPESVKSLLHTKPCDYARAVIMALRLNELNLTTEAVESVPVAEIPLISHAVGERYALLLLEFSALQLDRSRHLEFYLTWIQTLLFEYGAKLKSSSASIMPLLHLLQKALVRKKEDFLKLAQRNASSIRYTEVLVQLAQTSRSSAPTESVMEADD